MAHYTKKAWKRKLDELAQQYRDEPDAQDLIFNDWENSDWTDAVLQDLTATLSLYFVKAEGDWREDLPEGTC